MVQVRSCTLDTWLPAQVAFMAQTGNSRANAFYEARLGETEKPAYGSKDIAPFIHRKVERLSQTLAARPLACTSSRGLPKPSRLVRRVTGIRRTKPDHSTPLLTPPNGQVAKCTSLGCILGRAARYTRSDAEVQPCCSMRIGYSPRTQSGLRSSQSRIVLCKVETMQHTRSQDQRVPSLPEPPTAPKRSVKALSCGSSLH